MWASGRLASTSSSLISCRVAIGTESKLKDFFGQLKADLRDILWLGFLLPLLLPDYRLFYAISVVILIPVVVGYNLITGYGGLFVLTSGPMVGLGGVVAAVAADPGLFLPLSLVAGSIFAPSIGFSPWFASAR